MKKSKVLLCQWCGVETMNFSIIEVEDIYKVTAKLAVVCRACKKHFRIPKNRLGVIPRQFWDEHNPHVEYLKLKESTSFKQSHLEWLKDEYDKVKSSKT